MEHHPEYDKKPKYLSDWGEGSSLTRLMRKVRVALTPRASLLATPLSNGAVVYGRNRPGHGGRGVYIFRDSLEPELYDLEHFLDTEGVFIDIGANTGMFSLKAAKHYGGDRGTVIAIEPFPETMAILFHSVKQNGFTNMRVRNYAVGAETGTATFYMNNALPNMFALQKIDQQADALEVMVVRLDDLIEWEGLERLDFVKIDVERAEEAVLAGGHAVLARYRPILCMENWLEEIGLALHDYRIFKKVGGINRMYIPAENAKCAVALRLGYREETPTTA